MTRRQTYVQCRLRRMTSDGWAETTSYIPQQYAAIGRALRLRDEHRHWTNGWIVQSVSQAVVEADELPDYRKAIRMHRKATGDSEPRMEA